MQTLWLISNPNSGSATQAKCQAIEAVISKRSLNLAGRTLFPDDTLPTGVVLNNAGVDTLVLFAGDGTINAALCGLEEWDGAFLILPGGTMNMLAKQLHDASDRAEIVHAAHESGERVPLSYVEAGVHRAFVGLIFVTGRKLGACSGSHTRRKNRGPTTPVADIHIWAASARSPSKPRWLNEIGEFHCDQADRPDVSIGSCAVNGLAIRKHTDPAIDRQLIGAGMAATFHKGQLAHV